MEKIQKNVIEASVSINFNCCKYAKFAVTLIICFYFHIFTFIFIFILIIITTNIELGNEKNLI